jgi:hypothetical protein
VREHFINEDRFARHVFIWVVPEFLRLRKFAGSHFPSSLPDALISDSPSSTPLYSPAEKHDPMATKRQTRLQFRRQAKENAPPPPITTLISQYELLTSLCQHLSSADIIHLGATSKEHWQYLTGSPKLLRALIRNSSCDGRGIAAQARIFGYWDYKPERAMRKCRGKDAQPCHDCGAMVCNVLPPFFCSHLLSGY